jgi:hypothetical protein
MAGNPRTVTADTVFLWDGVSTRLAKGQAIDVVPGSPLERAIGKDKLVPLGPTSALPPAEEAVPEEKPAKAVTAPAKPQQYEVPSAPPKAAAAPKKQDSAVSAPDSKDGAP